MKEIDGVRQIGGLKKEISDAMGKSIGNFFCLILSCLFFYFFVLLFFLTLC